MGAWEIVGIVVASVVLVFAALGCIPGRLLVTYDAQEGLRLRGSVLGIPLGGGKPKPKKEPEKPQPPKETEAPKTAGTQSPVSLRMLTDHAGELAELLGKTLRQLGKMARRIAVRELKLLCVVGGDDPAEAADTCGTICAILYPVLAVLHETLRVNEKHEQVDLSCAFGGESVLEFRLLLQLRVADVLRALLPLTPPALGFLLRLRRDAKAPSRAPRSKAQSRTRSD